MGRKQAELTGRYLSDAHIQFDGFYCSPLKRAVETATIIGERIGQVPLMRPGIHEMEYHELPTAAAMELVARTGILKRYFAKRIGKPLRFPMMGRVAAVMLALLQAHEQGCVGIVAHGGVVSSVMAWYFPEERVRWWRETVGNCSITRLEVAQAQARLIVFDQVAHLDALAAEAHARNYTFSAQERL
jgi:probable phosphoglycerate mutase